MMHFSCKRCDDPFASNFDERGKCEFISPAAADIGFTLDGNHYSLTDPENGGVWNGICSDWNAHNQTTMMSWMNFNWHGETWTLQLEVPIEREFEIPSNHTFHLNRPSPCPSDTLNACAILYTWNEQSSNYDEYVSTDSVYSGIIQFTRITDGAVYENGGYWYANGRFSCQFFLDGSILSIENGFFSNAVIQKKFF